MSVTFEGLESIDDMLESLLDERKVRQALKKACALVEREAKIKAPKQNGELRNSIQSKVVNDSGDLAGVVFTPLEFAPYVEYGTGLFAEGGKGRKEVPWVYVENSDGGTHKKTVYESEADALQAVAYLQSKGLDAKMTYGQHPQPFLRPALLKNREKIIQILKESLTDD